MVVQPDGLLGQGGGAGGVLLEHLSYHLGFVLCQMDSTGVFRVTEPFPFPSLRFPARLVAEGDAADVTPLDGPLAQPLGNMIAQSVGEVLGEAPQHLDEQPSLGSGIVDILR